jgi:beta-mannosidase
VQGWMKGWGIKMERSVYKNIPPITNTPQELLHAREVWETWRFHDFQPAETFDNGISLGASLDQFIANSQAYQASLIQYGTECYRRAKYINITGIIQFDFCDPWPCVTWSVVDYWRVPKPAYYSLQRSMQPVLPCFILPDDIKTGKEIPVSFCVVNDLLEAFPASICEWRLEDVKGEIASDNFKLDIPADGISTKVNLALPSLLPGKFILFASVKSNLKQLGNNWYKMTLN